MQEELCFEEVGSLEMAAGGVLTIMVFAQLGKRKEQLLGSVMLPVGLGVDHGTLLCLLFLCCFFLATHNVRAR